jgi:hypothetical protein
MSSCSEDAVLIAPSTFGRAGAQQFARSDRFRRDKEPLIGHQVVDEWKLRPAESPSELLEPLEPVRKMAALGPKRVDAN